MCPKVTELEVKPAQNDKGLKAFLSFVVDDNYYIGSVGLYAKAGFKNQYRLVYPTKLKNSTNYPIFYPINREYAQGIESQVISLYEDLK